MVSIKNGGGMGGKNGVQQGRNAAHSLGGVKDRQADALDENAL
jgi:hypothetical protein